MNKYKNVILTLSKEMINMPVIDKDIEAFQFFFNVFDKIIVFKPCSLDASRAGLEISEQTLQRESTSPPAINLVFDVMGWDTNEVYVVGGYELLFEEVESICFDLDYAKPMGIPLRRAENLRPVSLTKVEKEYTQNSSECVVPSAELENRSE